MIGFTRYLQWRRRRRAGWFAVLMTTVVCLVLTSVPAVATPVLPVPTDPVPTAPVPTNPAPNLTGSCVSPEDPLAVTYPPGIPGLSVGLSECQAAGQDTQSEGSDPPGWEEEQRLQEQYGMSGCREVPGFNDRCPVSVGETDYPSSDGYQVTEPKFVSSPDGQWLYGVGWEMQRVPAPLRWVAVITAYRVSGGNEVAWRTRIGLGDTENPRFEPFNTALNVAVSHDGSRLFVTGTTYYIFVGGMQVHVQPPMGVWNDVVVHGYSTGPKEDGWVAAVDTADGDIIWNTSLRPLLGARAVDATSFKPFGLTISPDDQRVFVSAGVLYGLVWAQGPEGAAWHFSLDAASGLPEWAREVNPLNPLDSLDYSSRTGVSFIGRDQLKMSSDGSRLYSQVYVMHDLYHWVTQGFMTMTLDTATGMAVWTDVRMADLKNSGQADVPPSGLVVAPDDGTVYSLQQLFYTPDYSDTWDGRYQVHAYNAVTGSLAWSRDYSAKHSAQPTGCEEGADERAGVNGNIFGSALALNPSGSLLYLMMPRVTHFCGDRMRTGVGVWAVQATTGDVEWATFHNIPNNTSCWWSCDLAVAPGPAGGDVGSQVIVVATSTPPWARWGAAGYRYTQVIDLNGIDGHQLWQARYLDTYNDENSFVHPWGGGVISPDGTQLHVPVQSHSGDDWTIGAGMQVLTYDLRDI